MSICFLATFLFKREGQAKPPAPLGYIDMLLLQIDA